MTEKKIRTTQLGTVGKIGEDLAFEHINSLGLNILDRNVKFGRLELDLIYIEGNNIVFCEVKARSVAKYAGNSRFSSPAGAVTVSKQQKLIKAAREYLKLHPTSLYPRFDVIEVIVKKQPDGTYSQEKINRITHAFTR